MSGFIKIENAIIKTEEHSYCIANISVEDGLISEIEITEKELENFTRENYRGKNIDFFVTPGFVNCHLHPNQLFDRRILDDLDTHCLLSKMHTNFEKTYQDRHIQALFVLIDAIKSGSTTIYSVASNPMPVIDAYTKIGLKGAISCFFNDQWETSDKAPKKVDILSIENSFQEYLSHKTDKIDIHIGAASLRATSNDLLILLNNLAQKYNTKVNMHLSECQKDVTLCLKNRGTTPVRLLDQLGVLNKNWNLIHTVAIDNGEIEIIAKNGTCVIHCPISNAKTGAGIAPIKELIQAGVTIGLGTDACSNNNTNNILNEAYFASLIYSAKNNDPKSINTNTLWQWLTKNGYDIIGRKNSGQLKIGQPADLLMWDIKSSAFVPLCYKNFDYAIFYNAPDIKPHTVLIDGKKVVENYFFTKLNEREIRNEANSCALKIYENIGMLE